MSDVFDVRERFFDFDEVLETLKDAVQSKIKKAMPVIVMEDSTDGHTVKLQSALKAAQRMPDGTTKLVEMPPLPDIPIHHIGGGGITLTHGIKKSDEGILIVSDAGINFWHQQGGPQTPGDGSQHPLSEAFFIPGVRSDPRKLQGVSPDSTQTRTDDKKSVHDVSNTAIASVREGTVVQVNALAAQIEKLGAKLHVDGKTILQTASKLLLNC
jgi:hypothetical protein